MAKFKIILSDPEVGKSQTVELEGSRAVPLVGRKLGETIDGTAIGLGGHKLKITGGSDKDGFPMRPEIHGGVKTRVIVTKGVGFNASQKGERRRKTLRGCVITEETFQINMKIVEKPKKAEKPEQPETKTPKTEKAETKQTEEKAETEKVERKAETKETEKTEKQTKEKPKKKEAGGQ